MVFVKHNSLKSYIFFILYLLQVFQGPGFSGSRFFRVEVFQGPGSGSRVQVRIQGLGPGFRSSDDNLNKNAAISIYDENMKKCVHFRKIFTNLLQTITQYSKRSERVQRGKKHSNFLNHNLRKRSINNNNTAQKMKFFTEDFFSKCYQVLRKLLILSHLLKKFLKENFICCAVQALYLFSKNSQRFLRIHLL